MPYYPNTDKGNLYVFPYYRGNGHRMQVIDIAHDYKRYDPIRRKVEVYTSIEQNHDHDTPNSKKANRVKSKFVDYHRLHEIDTHRIVYQVPDEYQVQPRYQSYSSYISSRRNIY